VSDPIEKIIIQVIGNEKKILDDFCKAFLALKSSEGFPIERIFEEYTLCQRTEYGLNEITQKHWFEKRKSDNSN
jgi:hypothetical protein